ncbi:MAG: 2-succinyl-5-enolpyruvyl-6-hydroxy-3-cyclohexene-1-carboxylate synthase [Pelodictyon luteolum]|uniref:2-succinyl-5-enolpyruvyl-6-hydroxy-3-cyclohexene-1-carboxylate synthase n=1 Tax=Pelodictyon luteolum TaxID=1100 RepID=A0A165L2M6_PELLU|nr:2-succinyl-5-enolpyruvyl-6-hydroxy-3-cyclohexene-1-carboxylic-acid synthase [Pelodictyon luteolum]KZK73499.1 MAG: 2-succinyl-5-enolpyruvyl-6-hydroxy-3-cyclohexene-1-carboxylate synthase [Pelodictyon luteolum]
MNNPQVTTIWSTVLVEELIRQNASMFCISPGSRSTPLTAAVARNPRASWKMFPDERSAGFFALGHARATGRPAVLICTSGTAVANYFPAVVEASADFMPMIVISADRPFDLQECGANQTIRQDGIFGRYARWHMQLPQPSTEIPLQSLLSTVEHAVAKSLGAPRGPVHLNQPFREPFEPEPFEGHHPWLEPLQAWKLDGRPRTSSAHPERRPDARAISAIRNLLSTARRPLLIAGSMPSPDDARAVASLADDLRIPLYADLSSGLRLTEGIRAWQQAFAAPAFLDRFRPDLVVHFGGRLIARHPSTALKAWKPAHYVVVREHPERYAPDLPVNLSLESSLQTAAESLMGCRSEPSPIKEAAEGFFRKCSGALDSLTEASLPLSEISVARQISQLITPGEALFTSNSMSVRELDSFAAALQPDGPPCGLNRGASGIDGIISTAAGYAEGLGRKVTLLIGDIAFLHDLNALSLLRSLSRPMRIVLLNNNGGGIFSFLPVASCNDIFEDHFATPQHFQAQPAAAMFGLLYAAPRTNREFEECFLAAGEAPRSTIIEIASSRSENVEQHRTLQARFNAFAEAAFTAP